MNSKMYAVTNTSAHHFESTLGTVGDVSPTVVLATSVAAPWTAKGSERKYSAPDLEGLAGTNGALRICFDQYRVGTTQSTVLKTREMGGRYLPHEGASIIAKRVQARHAQTSHAEAIGDANLRV